VLIDEDNKLIAGRGRVPGAQLLVLHGHERSLVVPVIVARGWDDAMKRAYMIADNRLAERSDWNLALLSDELRCIDSETLGVIGFSDEDLVARASDTSIAFDDPLELIKRNAANMEAIKEQRRRGNAGIVSKTDTEKRIIDAERYPELRREPCGHACRHALSSDRGIGTTEPATGPGYSPGFRGTPGYFDWALADLLYFGFVLLVVSDSAAATPRCELRLLCSLTARARRAIQDCEPACLRHSVGIRVSLRNESELAGRPKNLFSVLARIQ
jgi:hypothetical protein